MLWLRRSSYNSKLLVLIMIISGITLALAGMSFVVSDTLLFRRYVQRDLDGLSQIIATSSATALVAADSDAARNALAGLRARPYVAEACLYYRTGDLLARYARDDLQVQCPDAIMADSQHTVGEDLQLFRTVTQNGQAVGHLFFDYRIGEAQAERRRVYIEWAAIIVFKRDGDKVRLFWAAEMTPEMADPGEDPRTAPDIASLWSILDLTPGGRGKEWYPKLRY